MANRKSEEISRRTFIGVSVGAAVVVGVGCGTNEPSPGSGSAGQPGTGNGGAAPGNGGAAPGNGGAVGNGGATTANGGGAVTTGGTTASSSGGATGTGGTSTAANGGSTTSTGGASTTPSGGKANGGSTSSTGGATTTPSGGKANGGSTSSTGGASTTTAGGNANGGTTATGGAPGNGGAAGSSTGVTPMIALVRPGTGTDAIAQATMDAIAKIGLPDLKGKKVVIRPNQIEAKPDGTTNPEVIRGIIRAIKAASSGDPASIVVAEDAFSGTSSASNMQTNGVTAVCTAEGATVLDLKGSTDFTNRKPANATAWAGGIDFYNVIYNADYVINCPRCKTHGLAGFSLSLKAWFGSVKRPGDLHTGILNKCAEAHLARKEDMVVLDATRCMVTGGPSAGGTMKDSNIVAASKDGIVADVTGVAIIRYNGGSLAAPWTHGQITRAMAIAIPGWITAKQDFPYYSSGITEIADIMAKRN